MCGDVGGGPVGPTTLGLGIAHRYAHEIAIPGPILKFITSKVKKGVQGWMCGAAIGAQSLRRGW